MASKLRLPFPTGSTMISRDLCGVTFEHDTSSGPTFPQWPCPKCGHVLGFAKYYFGSAPGVGFAIDEGYMERHDNYGVFTANLICENAACQLGVAVLGDFSMSCDGMGVVPGGFDGAVTRKYVFKAIHPSPNLVAIPSSTPASIAAAVNKSFPLYWQDPQACAGSMRIAIEEIADHLVARPTNTGGMPISLSNHLKAIKISHPQYLDHADAFLLIMKKLGNAGAHGDPVERDRLLDAYELLEMELGKLFVGTRRNELIDRLTAP